MIAKGNKSSSNTPFEAKHNRVFTLLLGHGLSMGQAQFALVLKGMKYA